MKIFSFSIRWKYVFIPLGTILFLTWIIIANPQWSNPWRSIEASTVSPAELKKHVEFLSTIDPPRNHGELDSLNRAADYIRAQFEAFGVQTEFQNFIVEGHDYKNVIARFGPEKGKKIIIGAHYDVASDLPGADDNASGVAGLIEVGQQLQNQNIQLPFPVELVAYTLEEPPYFYTSDMGSAFHAFALHEAGAEVEFMISIEMIGYYTDEFFSQNYPVGLLYLFYPWQGNFITIAGLLPDRELTGKLKSYFSAGSEIPIYSLNIPPVLPEIEFSDHLNYWKYDWPGLIISNTAFYRNDQYHQAGDTADRLDYQRMAQVVDGIVSILKSYNNPNFD